MNTIPLPSAGLLKRLGARACLVAGAFGASAATLPATVPAGVYPSYPPLDMRDPATGTPTGFDIDLGTYAALPRTGKLPASGGLAEVTIDGGR